MKIYPSWRYHKTEAPFLVQDEKQEKELGSGWAESPAAFLSKDDLSALTEDELVKLAVKGGSKLAPITLKRRTKVELIKLIEEQP